MPQPASLIPFFFIHVTIVCLDAFVDGVDGVGALVNKVVFGLLVRFIIEKIRTQFQLFFRFWNLNQVKLNPGICTILMISSLVWSGRFKVGTLRVFCF